MAMALKPTPWVLGRNASFGAMDIRQKGGQLQFGKSFAFTRKSDISLEA